MSLWQAIAVVMGAVFTAVTAALTLAFKAQREVQRATHSAWQDTLEALRLERQRGDLYAAQLMASRSRRRLPQSEPKS